MPPEERLRRRIAGEGAVPFADFMAEALYGEEGYYRTARSPIGPAGDFITGSSWSPLFGRTTARLVRRLDDVLGIAADVLEVGAGAGTHLQALLAALPAGERRVLACDRVAGLWPPGVVAIAEPEDAGPIDGLVFSYELFDALPVHRVVPGEDGELGELWVGLDQAGAFAWRRGALSRPELAAWFVQRGIRLQPGQVADVSLDWEPLYRRLARTLRAGLLVTCDYGFETARLFDPRVRFAGTLACYRDQRVHRDALRDPGAQDLTAHVDWTVLREAGEAEGLSTLGLFRQAPYLVATGIFEELAAAPGLVGGARRLLDGEGMGEEIRVLIQARGTGGQKDRIRTFEQLFKPTE